MYATDTEVHSANHCACALFSHMMHTEFSLGENRTCWCRDHYSRLEKHTTMSWCVCVSCVSVLLSRVDLCVQATCCSLTARLPSSPRVATTGQPLSSPSLFLFSRCRSFTQTNTRKHTGGIRPATTQQPRSNARAAVHQILWYRKQCESTARATLSYWIWASALSDSTFALFAFVFWLC